LTYPDEDKGKASINKYTYGMQNQREKLRALKHGEDSENEGLPLDVCDIRQRKSVIVIRNDENIKKLICSRSTCYYGYVAILDESKVTIYLTQNDDNTVSYDLVMHYDFWKLRQENLGSCIETLDFTTSCDEFIGVTSNMTVIMCKIN
jgi:hypothetical protein